MTDAEIQKFGADIATAIRARGQQIADIAKVQKLGSGANLIVDAFEQAAQVAELRTQFARMDAAKPVRRWA